MKTTRVTVTAPSGPTVYVVHFNGIDYAADVDVSASESLSDRLTAQIAALTVLRNTVRFYESSARE